MNTKAASFDKARKNILQVLISVVRWIFFILIAFVVIYPIFTKIISMFMTVEDIHDMSVIYIPRHFTMNNIISAFNSLQLKKTYPYTFFYTFCVAFLQMASTTLVGYGLARFDFALNKPLLFLCLAGLILPPDLLQIPLFNLFRNFNLFGLIPAINGGETISFINTAVPGIVLAIVAGGFRCGLYILIMRQFFRGMPKEIEEAAAIDGSEPIGTFFRIMLPGAVTMMVTVFLFAFVWTWLDTDFSSIFMGESNFLAVKVSTMNNLLNGNTLDQATQNLITYAGIIYLIIPLVILYLFTQKFFVESVERSGIVG